ncbi:hypothetical protein ScPMuIL_003159 [Solemya velum]
MCGMISATAGDGSGIQAAVKTQQSLRAKISVTTGDDFSWRQVIVPGHRRVQELDIHHQLKFSPPVVQARVDPPYQKL